MKIDGEPVRRPRRDVSFMFQKPALLPWRNVLENVMLPAEFLKLDEKRHENARWTSLNSPD